MNKLELNNTGGFPMDTNVLAAMQDAYTMIGLLAKVVAGMEPSILDGCETTGATVAAGHVIIQGEILPFEGGAIGSRVAIIEEIEVGEYEDGVTRPILTKRKAAFSVTGTLWTDFWLSTTLKGNAIKPGMIVAWSGLIADIPTGWALHTASAGKFIVNYDGTVVDYNDIGKVGGLKEVILTASQIPSHAHTYRDRYMYENGSVIGVLANKREAAPTSYNGKWGGGAADQDNDTFFYKDDTTGNSGGGTPHENRPPYYVLAYIVKL